MGNGGRTTGGLLAHAGPQAVLPLLVSRRMRTVDHVFEELALAFRGRVRGDGDIAYPRELERSNLDYSLRSLRGVDAYLDYVHRHSHRITEDEWRSTVLWGGAYLGEVIRR